MSVTLELTQDEMIVLRYVLLSAESGEPLKDVDDCEEFRGLDRREVHRRANAAYEALKRKIQGDDR